MEDPQKPNEKPPLPGTPPVHPSEKKKPVDPKNLSPAEQMERYEEDLKENDWGHQPC